MDSGLIYMVLGSAMYEVEFKVDRTGLDPYTVEALIPSSFDEQSCMNHTRPLPRQVEITFRYDPARELLLPLQLVKVSEGFHALASQQYIFIDIARTLILTKAFISVSISHTNFSHIVGSKDFNKITTIDDLAIDSSSDVIRPAIV
jgi:hypothetical protein